MRSSSVSSPSKSSGSCQLKAASSRCGAERCLRVSAAVCGMACSRAWGCLFMLTFVGWIQEVRPRHMPPVWASAAGTCVSLRDADILLLHQAAPLRHVAGKHSAQLRAGAAPDLHAERLELTLDVGRGERLLDGGLDFVDDGLWCAGRRERPDPGGDVVAGDARFIDR